MIKFKQGVGLFKDERFIWEYNPIMEKVIVERRFQGERILYQISLYDKKGENMGTAQVKSLKSIDYFTIFGATDALLSNCDRLCIQQYLQEQYRKVKPEYVYVTNKSGLISAEPLLAIYDMEHYIAPENYCKILCETDFPQMVKGDYSHHDKEMYLDCLFQLYPGVTDVMFFAELFAKVKPIFYLQGIDIDFSIALYGVPGSGKSRMAKLVHCISPEQRMQFSTVKKKQLFQMAEKYAGFSLLIDDLHKQASSNAKQKQSEIHDLIVREISSKPWALIVTTGEFTDGIPSLQERQLQIHVASMDAEKRSEFEKCYAWLFDNRAILWAIYHDFFRFAYENYFTIAKSIKTNLSNAKKSEKRPVRDRIEFNIRILIWVATIFEKSFSNNAAEKAFKTTLEMSLHEIKKWQQNHLAVIEEPLENVRWELILFEIVEINGYVDSFENSKGGNLIVKKKDYLFIKREKLLGWLERKLEHRINLKQAIDYLADNKIIHTDNSDANTVKAADGGRYYKIYLPMLEAKVTKGNI